MTDKEIKGIAKDRGMKVSEVKALIKSAELLGVSLDEMFLIREKKERENSLERARAYVNALEVPEDIRDFIEVRIKGLQTSSVKNSSQVEIPELNFQGTRTEAKIKILTDLEGLSESEAKGKNISLASLIKRHALTEIRK